VLPLTIPGAAFPVYAHRHKGVGIPSWAFFIAKYFGSGVIIATAFIHVSSKFLIATYADRFSFLHPQTMPSPTLASRAP